VERSGLTSQSENNVMLHEIPVHILVSKHIGIASEGG